MQFLKAHYEKIILSIVLLGLAHQWPVQCLLIVMAVLARRLLR